MQEYVKGLKGKRWHCQFCNCDDWGNLLNENGGHIVCSKSWAKRFFLVVWGM